MSSHKKQIENVKLGYFVGGGQVIATLPDGRKAFIWGGLPGEVVDIEVFRQKSSFIEAIVSTIHTPSPERIIPRDPESYLSTSPWQLLREDREEFYKAELIKEAFRLHHVELPQPTHVASDGHMYQYRNKMEFSWWWDTDRNQLDLAFFRRGSHYKIPVEGSSLAIDAINNAALAVRDLLRKYQAEARDLKTLLIRVTKKNEIGMQLYVKDKAFNAIGVDKLQEIESVVHSDIIYSDPKSPASVKTEVLSHAGNDFLKDNILGAPFSYAVDGFFQVNLGMYEQVLREMRPWLDDTAHDVVDLYAGVGTIGLSIGGDKVTLVESHEGAVGELKRTIAARKLTARAILARSEDQPDVITSQSTVIVDPPRAGLHQKVVEQLIATKPPRIIYLSCNPVTQARDIGLLLESGLYKIRHHQGYNFFPRTPHIEHLVTLDVR